MGVKKIIASTSSENSRQKMIDFHHALQKILDLTPEELQAMNKRKLAIEFGDYKLRCGSLMAHGWAYLLYAWPKELEDPLSYISTEPYPKEFYLFCAGSGSVIYPMPEEVEKILQQLKEFEAQ